MPKDQKNLVSRPPVVVVMGHIDHGKSTLLDYIRKSNVVAGEAGGITQHVGAYQATHTSADGNKHIITFLDTPGHEAFSAIRERGARAADIAILAVSAEDGVKPQTIEAFKVIKENKTPFIVALTKIDKPNADANRAKQSLGEHEIYVEGWGGDVPCVEVSAISGKGMPELLDMIMLVAELGDLKSDLSTTASGIIIESELDTRAGITATVLVQQGTLETGTYIVAGGSYAPVRFIEDFQGKKIASATPSMPARIVGWSEIPACGLPFMTYENKKEAIAIAEEVQQKMRAARLAPSATPKITQAADTFAGAAERTLASEQGPISIPIIIKTDVIGSLEGIAHELKKIRHDKVEIKVIAQGIGAVNENDVKTSMSDPNTILIGFGVGPDKKAADIIERSNVTFKSFLVIYDLVEFLKETLTSKIPKEYIDEVIGRAKILAVFSKEKDKQVIGGKVQEGSLESGAAVRILRRESEIGRGTIRELQQQKKRVSEVREGYEFGTMIEAKIEIAVGDKVEAVRTVEKKS